MKVGAIKLSVIVAVADNGVVGRNNALPWYLPADLQHFKRTTLGKPVVMGRKTYQSIGRPLPGRTNIVITRNRNFTAEGINVVCSLEAALELAREIASGDGPGELMVIGGAAIYAVAIPLADKLYITEVHAQVEGDIHLPDIDWREWRECSRERHGASESGSHDYSFVVYDRVLPK